MDTVSFDEFKKIELRTARILEAHDHPDADRLYVLKIDLGTEIRQLVAGIRLFYTKEELIGKDIMVITNLEPRTIRGIESNGMLLAAHDENGTKILVPEKSAKPGSPVS
jgi:methionyl-tRNA synthetase